MSIIESNSVTRNPRFAAAYKYGFSQYNMETREKSFSILPIHFQKPTGAFLSMNTARAFKEQALKFQSTPRENKEAEPEFFEFELPDGEKITLNEKLNFTKDYFDSASENPNSIELQASLTNAFQEVDVDVRKNIISNLVLTGGNSLLPNFTESLEESINSISAHNVKSKVFASSKGLERKMAPWIGASVMASTGAFQNMWISNHEYSELGSSVIYRKCVN
jgi:actin-related protein